MSDHHVLPPSTPISVVADSEKRQAALDSASGHLRMEGMCAPASTAELDERFVAGEIEVADMIEAIKDRYNV